VDSKPQVLIVEARYYVDICDELRKGAEKVLTAADVGFERIEVPGAFEIPAAIRMAVCAADRSAGRRRYDGFVTLGCVIRGETTHYDYVCAESARALQDLACRYTLALGYGILTCETREQAWARARVDGKDKGGESARACLAMLELKRRFDLFPRRD